MALKDDPVRLVAAHYARQFDTRILYSDMDAFRHLNNGAIGRYFEEGRADLNMQIFGVGQLVDPPEGRQLLFANVTIDYLRPARYPGIATIATGVTTLGNSSYVIAQAAFQNGDCFALAQSVMVKAYHGRAEPLSDAEREAIDRLRFAIPA